MNKHCIGKVKFLTMINENIHRVIYIFCLFFMICTSAHGQLWQRTNPGGGGWMMAVGAGPTGTILVGSDLSGAYRSDDEGHSWDVIGARNGLTATHVGSVGFDPNNDQVIFLGTNRGIFRSDNLGDTMVYAQEEDSPTKITLDIQISKADSDIGFAASHPTYNSLEGVVLKTLDNGISWSQISEDLPNNLRIIKLILDPKNPDILFALSGFDRFKCGPAELYRSQNGGQNWTKVASTISDTIQIMDASISPINSNEIYLTTMNLPCNVGLSYEGDLYKSSDGGDTWTNPNPTDQEHSGIIWLNPNDPLSIKLIDVRKTAPWIPTSGTFSSLDGGNSWTKTGYELDWNTGYIEEFNADQGSVIHLSFGNNLCFPKTLGTDLSNPNKMYWVNKRFVYGTDDGGTTFNNLFTKKQASGGWQSTGIENVNLFDIEISQVNSNIIYAGFADNGLWRSLDKGESWESCNHPDFTEGWDGFGGNTYSIATDPENESTVWASTRGTKSCHIIKSEEFGEINSWVEKSNGLPESNRITDISIDPNSDNDNRTLFCVVSNNVYKSIDDGDNWNISKADGGVWFVEVDPNDSQVIYAGGSAGFFKSIDGGITWIESGLEEMADLTNTADFYRHTYSGVSCIHPSLCEPGVLFVAAYGKAKGLYKSNDFGDTWNKVYSDDYMRSVLISEVRSEYVFAGSSFVGVSGGYVKPGLNGMFISEDSGENWMPLDAELEYPSVVDLESTHEFPEFVFAISQCTGIQYAFNWLSQHEYYEDNDGDGFGNSNEKIITCSLIGVAGYVTDSTDCDDQNPLIFPGAEEIPNNGIDENCDGEDLISINTIEIKQLIKIYPNPVNNILYINNSTENKVNINLYSLDGKIIESYYNPTKINCHNLKKGMYLIEINQLNSDRRIIEKLIVH